MDEMAAWFSYPSVVKMKIPTDEELKKIEEKKIEHDRKAYLGLIAIAEGHGVKAKTVSKQQFFKEFGYE